MGTLAIVSNWPLKDGRFAERIDACDEVVRFSHCEGWGNKTGKKTTIWVQRSDASHRGPYVLETKRAILEQILPGVHTAYVVHSNFNHEPRWIPYNVSRLCREYPFLTTKVRGLDASALAWLHPRSHPTSGLVFLHHVLQHDLFQTYRKLLVSFDFVKNNLGACHAPEWEKAIIENWITRLCFERLE